MIKLKDLKIDEEYYIIDKDGCYDDAIIKFKVDKTLKGGNKKGHISVIYLKFIDYNGKENGDVKYSNDENVIEKLFLKDEGRIFYLDDFETVSMCLKEAEKKSELERSIFEIEDYTPPEDYPDWDGDESIMSYLDHCNNWEDEDEYIDVGEELDNIDIDDLLEILSYLNISEDKIESKLLEFWKYQGYNDEEIRNKIISNYLINNIKDQDIINAMNELNIEFLKDKDWDFDQ